MPGVSFVPLNRAADALACETVLDVARRAAVPLGNSCGGVGICARCRVEVVTGAESLSPMTTIEIRTAALPAAGARYVGITFDDGFENFISVAFPELQRRNIPSTVFIILDALGNEFGTPELLEKVMSADQLRCIPQDIVTLGSHTLTHPFLPSLRREEAVKELLESRLQLENILNRSVTLFSFPFGGFTDELIQLSREAGYARVFTTLPRLAFNNAEEFAVGRIRADTTDWPLEFRLKIAGAYRWLPWAFAVKRRLLNNKLVVLARGASRESKTSQQIPSCLIRKSASSVEV